MRTRQAARLAEIYLELRSEGIDHIAVVGDLNKAPTNTDPPRHPTLEPLFDPATGLVDLNTLPSFDPGPRPGTFQSCGLRDRLDYILLSPAAAAAATGGGIFRKGLWGGPTNKNPPDDWDIYPEITRAVHAASDHAAIWVDLNL